MKNTILRKRQVENETYEPGMAIQLYKDRMKKKDRRDLRKRFNPIHERRK